MSEPVAGERLGPYRLLRPLGRGGMGEVRLLIPGMGMRPLGWSRDGQWIYYAVHEGGFVARVLRVPLAGGEPELRFRLDRDQGVTMASMGPEPGVFAARVSDEKKDLWLAEDFDPDRR